MLSEGWPSMRFSLIGKTVGDLGKISERHQAAYLETPLGERAGLNTAGGLRRSTSSAQGRVARSGTKQGA